MRINDENGQALVLTALALPAMLGCLALAVDLGMLFRAKRLLQTAADCAATAGALDYLYNASATSAQNASYSSSSANGFTNGQSGVVITTNVPPATGPSTSVPGDVEVTISKPISTLLMGVFGFRNILVSARAVAGAPTYGKACIWALAKSGTGLAVQGAYDIEAPSCGIYVNSISSNAVSVTGSGGTLNALFLDVVGNATPAHATNPTPVTSNAAPRTNPWGNLSGPTPTNGGCTTSSSSTSLTGTVSGPGAGSAICYTKAVTISNATLGAGTYVFEKGVTLSGTVTVSGGTIDIYSGTFNQGNGTMSITAPTSGTYNGIAIMQPASNANELQVQFGSSYMTLDGYIYAPGAEVYLQDHGGALNATGIVADWIYDKASTITVPSYDAKHPSTTPNRVITLLE